MQKSYFFLLQQVLLSYSQNKYKMKSPYLKENEPEECCPICFTAYDRELHAPMLVVCGGQHLYCNVCIKKMQKDSNGTIKCPQCRQTGITKDKVKKFRFFQIYQEKIRVSKKKIKQQYNAIIDQTTSLMKMQLKHKQQQIKHLLTESKKEEKMVRQLKQQANLLFKYKRFREASKIYQTILQNNPKQQLGMFIGLGSIEESIGYYENKAYEWLNIKYYGVDVSVYDLLGLCFMSDFHYEQQKSWYELMVEKHPSNFKFLYGLAVNEHNVRDFQSAEILYQRVIELNPGFEMPYQMLAFIEMDRKNEEKAVKLAENCLQIKPYNIFAGMIKGMCSKPQLMREKLLELHQFQEQFVRPLYELAKRINQEDNEQQHNQVIQYLKKCMKVNAHYYDPILQLGIIQIRRNQNYQKGIQILTNAEKKYALTLAQKKSVYSWIAGAFYRHPQKNIEKAIEWELKNYELLNRDSVVIENLAIYYFQLKDHSTSLKFCEQFCVLTSEKEVKFHNIFKYLFWNYSALRKLDAAIMLMLELLEDNLTSNNQFSGLEYKYKIFMLKSIQEVLKWQDMNTLDKDYWIKLHFHRIRILEQMGKDRCTLKAVTELLSKFMHEITWEQLELLTEKTLNLQMKFKSKKQMLSEKREEKEKQKGEDEIKVKIQFIEV